MSDANTGLISRVSEVDVRDNQVVRAGQILFKLDPRNFQVAVEDAKAQLDNARIKIPALVLWGPGFGLHHLFTRLLQLAIFAAWIIMLIKVSHDENYRLPIIGELAERSVSEQRT